MPINPSHRIVTRTPLTELWDASGPIEAARGVDLDAAAIRDMLRAGSVVFVVADCGQPLQWVPKQDGFAFWKDEVVPHLANGQTIQLADYPDEYCYVASRWDTAQVS